MPRLLGLSVLLALAAGCHQGKSTEVRVLGVRETQSSHVFVQVTNPASRPMRLTHLDYTFASARGTTVAEGEVALAREVPPGAAVVVEVPLESDGTEMLELDGKLTAEQDQMVRTFRVVAQIQPH